MQRSEDVWKNARMSSLSEEDLPVWQLTFMQEEPDEKPSLLRREALADVSTTPEKSEIIRALFLTAVQV